MFSLHRAAVAIALMFWVPLPAAQSVYPTKPIHMVVPLAAGSAVDNAMRIVTQRMTENMGQGIVIDNQPGAAGLIGAERVAKAAPDGYTIGGFNDSIMTMLPLVVFAGLFVRRTLLEDRLLKNELEGYAEYAQKVPYRFIAGLF